MTEFPPTNYDNDEPNAPIQLYEGPVTLTLAGAASEFQGTVKYVWLPSPRAQFTAERSATRDDFKLMFQRDKEEPCRFQIPGLTGEVEFFPAEANFGTNCPIRYVGHLDAGLEIGSGEELRRVEAQVVNLDEYWAPKPPDEFRWDAEGWTVTITPVDDLHKRIKSLKASGGYIFTHRMTIERTDGELFDAPAVDPVLRGLYRFLSYMQGRVVNAILRVGFDAEGVPAWRVWGSWIVGPWQSVNSWADPHDTGDFGQAFAGFMRLWSDPHWREALDAAIHWYVDSNRNASVIEVGTVLNQMGLERLAWEYLTRTKSMNPDVVKHLKAPERIRRLLTDLKIPHALPPELPDLAPWAQEFRWRDIASAITLIRNTIIHPDQKHRPRLEGASDSPVLDVWRCGLWALELVLLRLFGYSGGYQDRRKSDRCVGQTDPVPWAQPTVAVPGTELHVHAMSVEFPRNR